MLTEIRDRSSGWFAWIIAGLIIIPMAFWGVNEYASTEAMPTIIEVGDQKITQQAFQAQLASVQAQEAANNPSLANSDIFSSEFFKRQVLDGMINRALVEQIASEYNYQVGDAQLAEVLKQAPLFQVDGKFDKAAYETYAQTQGLSKTRFEQNQRANIRFSQVSSGYNESALVLPAEVRSLLEIQAEQREFDLITIRQADFIDGIEVSDAEIADHYNTNQDSFMNPDSISVNYIELSLEQIASEEEVSEEDVRAAYEDNIDSYISVESRTTSHILLSTSGGEDDEQLAKAEQLLSELKSGGDFAELAKEHSQDPGSAATGGSLGDVERGAMVPEFEDATFSLAEGEISQPVKTDFGYHLIKVEKINGGEPQAFEEVKVAIEQDVRERQAQEVLLQQVEQLRNLVFEQPESLEAAATELGLEIQTTGFFTRANGEGIASNEAIRSAAFSEQVVEDSLNSAPVELANGVYVALRKKDFSPEAAKPLEEVSAQIKTLLTNQAASQAAKSAGDTILQKAQLNWGELTKDANVTINSYEVSMIDNQPAVATDVLREVLKMQLDGNASKVRSFSGTNGDFNIVRLTKVVPGDLTQVSEQIKESTRRLIAQRNGQSLFQSYIQGMRKELDDQIDEDLL